MTNIKRLHKIIQEMGSDPNVSMHELVREVLKQDQEFEDYYINNISQDDENENETGETEMGESETEAADQSLPVEENIADVQARLDKYLKKGQKQPDMEVYDKDVTSLETIDRLKDKLKKRLDRGSKVE